MKPAAMRWMAMCVVALSSVQVVAAQEARIEALLEPFLADAARGDQDLRTFDYTLRYDVYNPETGEATANRLRFAADLQKRFLYTDSVFGRTTRSQLLYRNGATEAFDLRMGGRFSPPPELVAPFIRWLDQATAPSILSRDLKEAVYEGRQEYGKLLSGEQIKVKALIPDALGVSLGRVTVKLLFGETGEHLATLYSAQAESELLVYADPSNPETLPRYLNGSLYTPTGRGPLLVAKISLEHLSLNRPLEPGLLEVKNLNSKP